VEHVPNAQSQGTNNRSKLKDKECNADQVVVMSTCNFHTLEANGSECCSKDSQGYTPRTCYSFNYKNGT
jgi:hypothetical protein